MSSISYTGDVPQMQDDAQQQSKSRLLSFRSSTAFITLVIAYAVFTDQFLFAVIIPVAPFALIERMHIAEDRVQFWVALMLGVYGIACFTSSAPWGWYSDRSPSRRTPWLLGLFVLLGATVLLWLAPNNAVSILGRVLQGVSSTVIWTTGLAIMVDTVSEKHIGEYMGYIGIALNVGTLIGPLAGGLVFANRGYNAVFFMTFAVIGLDVLLRLLMVEQTIGEASDRSGDTGEIPLAVHIDLEMCKAKLRDVSRPESGITVITTATSATWDAPESWEIKSADMLLIASARQAPNSRMPAIVTLLYSWRFSSALWCVFVQASIYSGLEAVLPLKVHHSFGWTSTGGGVIFLPFMAPSLLGPLVGKLSDRFGPRWLATGGFLLLCPSLVLLRFVDHNSASQKALLCVLLAVIGLALTLTLEPIMAEITHLAREHNPTLTGIDMNYAQSDERKPGSYAQAYALFNMAWSAGNVAGPFLAGLVIEHAGWKTMSWSLGLLGGVSAIPTVLCCGGWLFARDSQS